MRSWHTGSRSRRIRRCHRTAAQNLDALLTDEKIPLRAAIVRLDSGMPIPHR